MDKNGYHTIEEAFGKKVIAVKGIITNPYGDLLFMVTRLECDDGTVLHVNGEHDCAYIEESWDSKEKLQTLEAERKAAGL